MATKHVVDGLFAETAEGPRLLGARCTTCEAPYFPKSPVCRNPDCDHSKVEDVTFGPRGVLWGFTIQTYPPPPPTKFDEPFTPYAMGFIDLDDGLRVLGRVSTDDLAGIEVGMKVELVIEPAYHDEEGNEFVTWKFKPI
jgi:uncharacterized OB-fold protein